MWKRAGNVVESFRQHLIEIRIVVAKFHERSWRASEYLSDEEGL